MQTICFKFLIKELIWAIINALNIQIKLENMQMLYAQICFTTIIALF